MRLKCFLAGLVLLFLALIPFLPTRVSGQTSSVPSRVSEAVDNSKLTILRGNIHPMARAEFDRGAAPTSLPMDHMLLVLKRSQDQESALQTLLAQQQDKSSPNYHKWLTPEEFGQQFGPSDQDIQKITSWLQSQGFHVNNVANGRTTIDFSGTAGQVQQALHTAMHSYVFANGEQHWANASNPQIPAALTSVVAGVNSLNNFPRKRMSHSLGVVRKSRATGQITRMSPQFTFAANCNGTNTNCFGIGPSDFATIYNVQSLLNAGINGAGQTIAIVSDSDINLSDVTSFRSLFGLPAINFQRVVPPGATNPGIEFNSNNADEEEAVLDVEWSGAVAQGATIDLVISASTNSTFGGDTSAQYIVNNNVAPILTYSYGACELFLGTAGNAFYQQLWSQAATEGITVLVSTGDSGSAGCDNPNANAAAQFGLAVNGVGSTPFNVAVGGTDFNDLTNPTTYFTNTAGTLSSAKSYIPETAWNDTCANAIIYGSSGVFNFSAFSTAEAACNNATVQSDGFLAPVGGSGGPSNCTTSSTTATAIGQVSSCGGGYAKPSWQPGSDGKRDTPDISLFAGDGQIQNFYVVCEEDLAAQLTSSAVAPCNLSSPFHDFVSAGGTSVSVQAFAGIMALVNQKAGSRQGNPNPNLYALAAGQTTLNCNASGTPSSNCIFNDVTFGTIAMPCANGSPNCTVNVSGDAVGILSGYSTGPGYDLATGLGSVNACNLVDNWITDFNNGGATFTLNTPSCPSQVIISSPGASNTMTLTVSSINNFSGTVTNFSCSGLPTGATCSFSPTSVAVSPVTSPNVTVTVNTTTASRLYRMDWPKWTGRSKTRSIAFLCVFSAGILLLWLTGKQRRWSTAIALIVFTLLTLTVACGGAGGGSTNSSSSSNTSSTTTPANLTVATVTASSGATVQQTTFTVNIQ